VPKAEGAYRTKGKALHNELPKEVQGRLPFYHEEWKVHPSAARKEELDGLHYVFKEAKKQYVEVTTAINKQAQANQKMFQQFPIDKIPVHS
jgi:hypothetical protein